MQPGDPPLEPIIVPPRAQPTAPPDPFARFQAELELGATWYLAALRATSEWTLVEEVFRRRRFRYLVAGEALDLLLVIERLAAECPGGVDRHELHELLFNGRPPLVVSAADFAAALGPVRYKAYLNYFYGVTLEETLLLVAELELAKAHALDAVGAQDPYLRIYNLGFPDLLAAFAARRGRKLSERMTWADDKDFTYWLFRYRLRTQLPARMASDTQKALMHLRELRGVGPKESPDPLRPDAQDQAPRARGSGARAVVDLGAYGPDSSVT